MRILWLWSTFSPNFRFTTQNGRIERHPYFFYIQLFKPKLHAPVHTPHGLNRNRIMPDRQIDRTHRIIALGRKVDRVPIPSGSALFEQLPKYDSAIVRRGIEIIRNEVRQKGLQPPSGSFIFIVRATYASQIWLFNERFRYRLFAFPMDSARLPNLPPPPTPFHYYPFSFGCQNGKQTRRRGRFGGSRVESLNPRPSSIASIILMRTRQSKTF